MYGYPGYGYGAGGWIGFGMMMFFGLIFLVGIVVFVLWLARMGQHGPTARHSGTSAACDIAKQRYAKGEITKEQFEEICKTVSG